MLPRLRERLKEALPRGLLATLRHGRTNGRAWLDRLLFPIWLIFQCAVHRQKAIVVWRLASLGDIICTLPLLRELRRRHPDRLFVFITLRGFENLLRLSNEVDLVYEITYDYAKPSWIRSAAGFSFGLVDQIHEPHTTDERTNSTEGPVGHLVDDLAGSCGLTLTDRQPHLHPPAELLRKTEAAYGLSDELAGGRLLIAINGGHTWPVREWDVAKWQQLIDRIHADYDATLLRFGFHLGPGVPDEYDNLTGVRPLISLLPLDDLVALIARCDLVVSIDSGPIHVAGAVGTPVVGLFGAVNPLYRLPPESPAVALVSEVPCLYCHHLTPIGHWKTNCPHDIRCMKQLEVEPVYQAIQEMLAKRVGRT